MEPMTIALVAGLAGTALGIGSKMAYHAPTNRYKAINKEYDPLNSYIPGYKPPALDKVAYSSPFANTLSKGLGIGSQVAGAVGTAASIYGGLQGLGKAVPTSNIDSANAIDLQGVGKSFDPIMPREYTAPKVDNIEMNGLGNEGQPLVTPPLSGETYNNRKLLKTLNQEPSGITQDMANTVGYKEPIVTPVGEQSVQPWYGEAMKYYKSLNTLSGYDPNKDIMNQFNKKSNDYKYTY